MNLAGLDVGGVTLTAANVVPLGVGYGALSAFVPIINAEVFVAAGVAVLPNAWWGPVLALSVGQTIGKCIMFLAARRGAGWLQRRHRDPKPERQLRPWQLRLSIWSRMLLELLDRPWQGFLVVLLAASVGIPPIAIVAVAAGTRRISFLLFTIACLVGRVARFMVLAWPLAAALN